jgi:hypothetical protein
LAANHRHARKPIVNEETTPARLTEVLPGKLAREETRWRTPKFYRTSLTLGGTRLASAGKAIDAAVEANADRMAAE